MLNAKKFLKLFLLAAVFGAGFLCSVKKVRATTQVTQVYRLSHPAFSMANNGQNARQPWNVDKSRILLFEEGTISNAYGNYAPYLHPDFATQRGTLSSAMEPFRSEEAWSLESGTTYKRHWRRDAVSPRAWLPNSLQEWTFLSSIGKEGWGVYTKYTVNKSQVINGAPGAWFYESATDLMYVKTFGQISPSDKNIRFVSDARNNIWGCLTEACVTATDNSGNTPAVRAIDATLPALNFDGVYNLDAAGKVASLAAWEKNTIDLPESGGWYDRPHWSPYADEPNIIYKLDRYNFNLTAYNVDTGQSKNILSYDPQHYGESRTGTCTRKVDGVPTREIDLATAQIYGFSKTALNNGDPHQYYMVILLEWGCTDGEWGQSYLIDIGKAGYWNYPNAARVLPKEQLWNYCDDPTRKGWYPKDQSIHNSGSPDGEYYVWDHSGPLIGKAADRSNGKAYYVSTADVNINNDTVTFASAPGWRVGEAVWYYCGEEYPCTTKNAIGGLESYYRSDPQHPNDYWVKTVSNDGKTVTLSDTPGGATVDLTTTGNNAQYFWLANSGACHDYTKSLGQPAGLGVLTIYIPEYWWSMDNDITHPSWFGNNNSFVVGNFAAKHSYPSIYDMKIYEYTFDRATPIPNDEYHRQANLFPRTTLLTHKNAAAWEDQFNPADDKGTNYHGGLPSVTDSLDYSQLFFAGTGKADGSAGRYTRQDYAWCQIHPTEMNCGSGAGEIGSLDWEGVGAYLALLNAPQNNSADVNRDKFVNIKDIQIVIQVITGMETDPDIITRANVNGDDYVNIKDIQAIIWEITHPS